MALKIFMDKMIKRKKKMIQNAQKVKIRKNRKSKEEWVKTVTRTTQKIRKIVNIRTKIINIRQCSSYLVICIWKEFLRNIIVITK